MVLFAQHDLLKDSPFSRLDLISLPQPADLPEPRRAAAGARDLPLRAAARAAGCSSARPNRSTTPARCSRWLDKKHRIFVQRPSSRAGLPMPVGPGTLARALEAQQQSLADPPIAAPARSSMPAPVGRAGKPLEGRGTSWGELHFKLLESLAPPSILVDAEHDIVHLSASAGRFLQFSGGEPSRTCCAPCIRACGSNCARRCTRRRRRRPAPRSLVSADRTGRRKPRSRDPGVARRPRLGAELFLVMFSDRRGGRRPPRPATAQPERIEARPGGAPPGARTRATEGAPARHGGSSTRHRPRS